MSTITWMAICRVFPANSAKTHSINKTLVLVGGALGGVAGSGGALANITGSGAALANITSGGAALANITGGGAALEGVAGGGAALEGVAGSGAARLFAVQRASLERSAFALFWATCFSDSHPTNKVGVPLV
jgi:hypothetical protein